MRDTQEAVANARLVALSPETEATLIGARKLRNLCQLAKSWRFTQKPYKIFICRAGKLSEMSLVNMPVGDVFSRNRAPLLVRRGNSEKPGQGSLVVVS